MKAQITRMLALPFLFITFVVLLLQPHRVAVASMHSTYVPVRTVAQSPSVQVFTSNNTSAPPNTFQKTYPPNGAVDVPVAFTITWTQAQGATRYLYCLDNIIDHTCEMGGQTGSAAFADANRREPTRTGMEFWGSANTTYEWQMIALNAYGRTVGNGAGQWFVFTTGHRPAEFKKQSPINGAILDRGGQVVLAWSQSVGERYYKYCLNLAGEAKCPDPINGWVSAGDKTNVATLNTTTVPAGTKVCYQIRAYYDATGFTPADAVGSWWCFRLR